MYCPCTQRVYMPQPEEEHEPLPMLVYLRQATYYSKHNNTHSHLRVIDFHTFLYIRYHNPGPRRPHTLLNHHNIREYKDRLSIHMHFYGQNGTGRQYRNDFDRGSNPIRNRLRGPVAP